jgi:hypothetical protein
MGFSISKVALIRWKKITRYVMTDAEVKEAIENATTREELEALFSSSTTWTENDILITKKLAALWSGLLE